VDSEHTRFMRLALEEAALARAKGNIGVGSLVVRDGVIVARGHNTVNSSRDLTAHAETVTLRAASREAGTPIPPYLTGPGLLAGHVLYTTVEPCPMCAFACCIAGVSTIVIGARFARMGVRTHGNYAIEQLLELTGQRIEIVSGILHDECAALRVPAPR
jgi:tRNA(Arg) A34 adenosine deaminase TadA